MVRIIGDISELSYEHFCDDLDKHHKPGKSLEIELTSEGGVADWGLAFYGKIRSLAQTSQVTITVYGFAASAAITVLAAGDIRRAGPEATFLIHDARTKIKDANYSDLLRAGDKLQSEENQFAKLLAMRTGTPASIWKQLSAQDTTMRSVEALQFNLLTSIMKDDK